MSLSPQSNAPDWRSLPNFPITPTAIASDFGIIGAIADTFETNRKTCPI
ncbi:MAG: hypothetical protein RMX68_006075 [Aulosira sp. ZfuVER01]|nr:hypothetical protein [Aulosira sp. ZfuVER01]MDZ8001491.1 hypothetical protein [Aulosira sp. DedVER01a]MDZ8051641.1 hypothetical protein [Aulosira sp. ZfuCHP01]